MKCTRCNRTIKRAYWHNKLPYGVICIDKVKTSNSEQMVLKFEQKKDYMNDWELYKQHFGLIEI